MAGKLSLSVTQLNEYVRRLFQMDPMLRSVEVKGEISNLKFHQTGAIFFTLKDENAAISCVMYAQDTLNLQTEPFEGMRVIVSGSVSLYTKGGQYQLYAKNIRAEGMGVLYERLLALKAKLSSEGLFEAERKRPIRQFIDTIGVVSSPTGAVIHDIMNVSLRRDPQARILLCPVRVQGMGAADEVAEAIRLLEQVGSVSVIIVARGGGSMEDLWTFNEERVVRAVAACTKPIVSAVGHETDVTLCDLAADLRAPTPSAAAECVVTRREEILGWIADAKDALGREIRRRIEQAEGELHLAQARLAACSPQAYIYKEEERLARSKAALRQAAATQMTRCTERLVQKRRELELLSPYQVLARGYAIVMRDGAPVESAAMLAAGDHVTLKLKDGSVRAEVLAEQKEDAK